MHIAFLYDTTRHYTIEFDWERLLRPSAVLSLPESIYLSCYHYLLGLPSSPTWRLLLFVMCVWVGIFRRWLFVCGTHIYLPTCLPKVQVGGNIYYTLYNAF